MQKERWPGHVWIFILLGALQCWFGYEQYTVAVANQARSAPAVTTQDTKDTTDTKPKRNLPMGVILWGSLSSTVSLVSLVLAWRYARGRDSLRLRLLSVATELERLKNGYPQSRVFIISADWGNEHSRMDVSKVISEMPPNALTFYVNPGSLLCDPAHGYEKYVSISYQFPGRPKAVVRRKEGEWVTLPEDPILLRQLDEMKEREKEAESVIQKRNSLQIENNRLVEQLASKQDEFVERDQRYSNQISKLKADCKKELDLSLKSAQEQWERKLNLEQHRTKSALADSFKEEACYLKSELERIRDWDDKEPEGQRIDLLYPLKGDQFGDRSTWRWQHDHLLKWKATYVRFCEQCKRLKLTDSLPPDGSPIELSRLMQCLSDAGRGQYPEHSSAEAP